MKYTNNQLKFIADKRSKGVTWKITTNEFNDKYDLDVASDTLRMALKHHKLVLEVGADEVTTSVLRQTRTARKAASKDRKVMNVVLDEIEYVENFVDVVLDGFDELVSDISEAADCSKVVSAVDNSLVPMTVEVMLSDLHFGKLTDTYNIEIARDRIRQLLTALLKELELHKQHHSIDEIVLALLGDIIESATMHGEESLIGCEFGNSMQVVLAQDILVKELIIPLANRGYKLKVVGVAGNHDRAPKHKTYANRGEEFLSYIIYKGLESICQAMNLDVVFVIPKEIYAVVDFYGSKSLYVHGDEGVGKTKVSIEAHMTKRSKQVGLMFDFIRFGHFHETTMYEQGRIISNGSLCGPDGFSDILGFDSHPIQVINFYCPSDCRPTSFYKSFPVYLR